MIRFLAGLWLAVLVAATPVHAQTFPKLTGRVVDQVQLLTPAQVVDISSKSEALEAASGRQFVVATVNSLEGRTIEDYGYRLGRTWAIGAKDKDDGVILLVAPAERKVRIETGYGARVVLTDLVSSVIIRNSILPAFRNGDMAAGIMAGTQQIIAMLSLPPAEAQRRSAELARSEARRGEQEVGIMPVLFIMVIFFFIVSSLARRTRGRRYRRRGWGGPIILWGPGMGGGGGGGWGGGGIGGFGGGGGGFSGGGGSFGGGGASGGW